MYIIYEEANSILMERTKLLVQQMIACRDSDTPPFLAEDYAKILGVNAIERSDLGKPSAVLIRLGERKIIKINQNHSFVKQNFSCAHEIGHILYDELKLERYVQKIEYRNYNPTGERETRSKVRERLCDAVATELLMPETIFNKYLSDYTLSVNSIERLARTFMVSIPAAAIRMAEMNDRQCIVALWKCIPQYKPNTLRFEWSAGPGKMMSKAGRFVPVTKQVGASSSQYKAYISGDIVLSYQLFKKGNITKRCRVESKRFGYNENRYVISLAYPNYLDSK